MLFRPTAIKSGPLPPPVTSMARLPLDPMEPFMLDRGMDAFMPLKAIRPGRPSHHGPCFSKTDDTPARLTTMADQLFDNWEHFY